MNDEELQRSIRALEFYRVQLESFEQQLEFLNMTLREHNRAKETMEGYKNLDENSETLIPIGANSFLFAKVAAQSKAMVGIGGDVIIETSIEDAISKLDERIKDIDEAVKNVGEKFEEIEGKAAEITAKIQNAYDSRRE